MKMPTKIIAIREKVKVGKYWLTFFITNEGACTVRFLAGLLGITPGTLLKRIEKYGAFNPIILDPDYLVGAAREYDVIGPTNLQTGQKYTLCPGHLDYNKTVEVRDSLSIFKFRENCIRDRIECQQYVECLGDRCEIEAGSKKGPWMKPGGEGDCYSPIKRLQPYLSSYLGKQCGFKW
jgi:hypothetical protein